MYCIGCGEPLRVTAGLCPSCRTPIVGAELVERVKLEYGAAVVAPPVCCCCLAPRFDTWAEELSTITLSGDKRYTKVPIPWCSGCRRRRKNFRLCGTIVWVVLSVALYFGFEPFVEEIALLIAFFGGLVASASVTPLLVRYLPNMVLPGHVPHCDAVHGSAGSDSAELRLSNRAFARIWRDYNAGIPSLAPAVQWAERRVTSGEPVRRETPKNTVVEGRARAREQMKTGVPPFRPRRIAFPTRTVGVDSAFEILRFALKALEIGKDRLQGVDRRGSTREHRLDEFVRIAARRTPDGPPFEGTIFLDVVPRSGEPLRIVPTTRANYGVLPGAGATSHENFRRLVRYLKARCPELAVEPDSAPYLEEGKGFPPHLETTEALVEHDALYLATAPQAGG